MSQSDDDYFIPARRNVEIIQVDKMSQPEIEALLQSGHRPPPPLHDDDALRMILCQLCAQTGHAIIANVEDDGHIRILDTETGKSGELRSVPSGQVYFDELEPNGSPLVLWLLVTICLTTAAAIACVIMWLLGY